MFDNIFPEKKFNKLKNYLIKNFVAKNFVGLVQIRNYAHFGYFYREVYYLLKYRKENLFTFGFWFYSLGCLFVPPFLLIPLVDWYKNNINSKILKKMKINFNFSYGVIKRK